MDIDLGGWEEPTKEEKIKFKRKKKLKRLKAIIVLNGLLDGMRKR